MPVVTYTKENGEMASCTERVCSFLLLLLAHSHYGSHKHWASCNGGYVGRKLIITLFNSTKFKKTISFLYSCTSIKIDWSSLTTSAIFPYECSPLKREAMSYLYHNVRIVSESGLCQQFMAFALNSNLEFMAFESRNRFIIDCKPLRPSWVVVGQWMLYMTFSQFIQYFRNSCFVVDNNNNESKDLSVKGRIFLRKMINLLLLYPRTKVSTRSISVQVCPFGLSNFFSQFTWARMF